MNLTAAEKMHALKQLDWMVSIRLDEHWMGEYSWHIYMPTLVSSEHGLPDEREKAMSGKTPEEAIENAWRFLTRSDQCAIIADRKRNVEIWYRWNGVAWRKNVEQELHMR